MGAGCLERGRLEPECLIAGCLTAAPTLLRLSPALLVLPAGRRRCRPEPAFPNALFSVACIEPTTILCRQDKKLKEGFARLQQENEALRGQLAQLAGRGAPVALPPALGGLQGLGGPSGGGRASRMGVLGMEAEHGLGGGGRPGTALAARLMGWGWYHRWGGKVDALELVTNGDT